MPNLTRPSGAPVSEDRHPKTAGYNGPLLVEDIHFFEKSATFNRERIPERVVHAHGSGAFGTFTLKHDMSKYTCAKIFTNVGKKTQVLARFSTVAPQQGAPETLRDPRGFALKFYTEEGNWDMVGNNTPIFFVREPLKFFDFIHSQKRDPKTNLQTPLRKWDFWSNSPESVHQVTILFSDRGTPYSFRHMHGYGSHTFSLYNEKGERYWVKFHFKSQQGIKNFMSDEEAMSYDKDHATKDLWNAIQNKDFPKWKLYFQIMTEEQAGKVEFDPFDLTTVWSQKDFPLIEVGEMELNELPNNFFEDIEMAAFQPSNIVRGIGFSPDPMLQGRLIAYNDAHYYRLGVNFEKLPVNKPIVPTNPNTWAGTMKPDKTENTHEMPVPNYSPSNYSSTKEAPKEKGFEQEPPYYIGKDVTTTRRKYQDHTLYFKQAGNLFRLMDKKAKERLVHNIVGSLGECPKEIQQKQVKWFEKADPEYCKMVKQGLGLN